LTFAVALGKEKISYVLTPLATVENEPKISAFGVEF